MAVDPSDRERQRSLGRLALALVSVIVGIVAGLGAVVFRGLIAVIHNLLFLGQVSAAYDATVHTPASPWGPLLIFVPVLGAVAVVFLVKNFAPEAKGHGVPEVMDAIYYKGGRIRPVVAAIKSLASAISIGSGGSVGREGPIIQIGSSFGSTMGQLLRVPAWQRIVLIAGGAGGGIAATFNTPVGGLLFALELMLHEVSARTIVPVTIATATATYVGRLSLGPYPSFVIPNLEAPYFHVTRPLVLFAYLGLGLIVGLAATLFIRSIYGFEDFFEKHVPGGYYLQHALGMLAVGLLIYGSMVSTGHYHVEGVGYATIQDVLTGSDLPLRLLLGLFVLKLLATSLTLGSGASGGIFSPALFLGATMGCAYGLILETIFPGLGVSPPAFAVAGMAGIVGSATGAALASIVMIFEMTLDYNVIIPMTIVVAIGYGVRKMLSNESIYTMKLVRRGHDLPQALRTSPHSVKRGKEIMVTAYGIVPAGGTVEDLRRAVAAKPDAACFLVEDERRIVGFIGTEVALDAVCGSRTPVRLAEMASRRFTVVRGDTMLADLISRLRAENATLAMVDDGELPPRIETVKGIITKYQLADAIAEGAELYMD